MCVRVCVCVCVCVYVAEKGVDDLIKILIFKLINFISLN